MSNYNAGLVEGFLEAHNAKPNVMAAFRSLLDGTGFNKQSPTPPNMGSGASQAMGQQGWSRWLPEDKDKLIKVVKERRAQGAKLGVIINELMTMFPPRKYNAIYTKLDALGLIDDIPKSKVKKSAPAKKAQSPGE